MKYYVKEQEMNIIAVNDVVQPHQYPDAKMYGYVKNVKRK